MLVDIIDGLAYTNY